MILDFLRKCRSGVRLSGKRVLDYVMIFRKEARFKIL